jgi:hypothetical protein
MGPRSASLPFLARSTIRTRSARNPTLRCRTGVAMARQRHPSTA